MGTKKVIINDCIGGYKVSLNAIADLMKFRFDVDELFYYRLVHADDAAHGFYDYVKVSCVTGDEDEDYENDAPHYLLYASYKDLGMYVKEDEKTEKYLINIETASQDDNLRTNPYLIDMLEKKGSDYVSADLSKLKIVEIPADVDYYIDDHDTGVESIKEKAREWR